MTVDTARAANRKFRLPLLTLIIALVLSSCIPVRSDSLLNDNAMDYHELASARTSDQWVCPPVPLLPRYQPTLYVSNSGSDSNDGRTPDEPLRTLRKAAAVVRPGDVVWLRGGTYQASANFTRSGTAGAPIIFESHPEECAILDGGGAERGAGLRFDGVSRNIIRNFVVRNSPDYGLFMYESHNNLVSNLMVHNNGESGILSMLGNGNVFSYLISYRNHDQPDGQDADGISISSGDNNHIHSCITFGNSDDGVDTWRSTNTLVERCISFHNGFLGGDGNGFKAGGIKPAAFTVVRQSIAFDNRTDGFNYNQAREVTFDNNTAFANGQYGFVLSGGVARNNLSFDNRLEDWAPYTTDALQQKNSWNLNLRRSPFASTSQDSTDFLSLDANSPAVAAGIPLGLPYTGAAPDLGALPVGQTLESFLRVTLKRLSTY